jgi:hypothetical protein
VGRAGRERKARGEPAPALPTSSSLEGLDALDCLGIVERLAEILAQPDGHNVSLQNALAASLPARPGETREDDSSRSET